VPSVSSQQPEPINTAERLGEELDKFEERLTILQTAYEKFFCGLERRPPEKERKAVSERIRQLRTTNVKNTGLRFRVQTLFARLLSYERLWDRTLREMEEGTYRRDLYKARMRQPKNERRKPPPPPEDEEEPRTDPIALRPPPEIAAPSRPPPAPRRSQPPPAAISDESMRRLYQTYLKARQQCGEPVTGLSYEAVASKIRSQIPTLLEKHKARAVDFKVVIKGGRAVLKAVPKL
jgi:hypothetical protein